MRRRTSRDVADERSAYRRRHRMKPALPSIAACLVLVYRIWFYVPRVLSPCSPQAFLLECSQWRASRHISEDLHAHRRRGKSLYCYHKMHRNPTVRDIPHQAQNPRPITQQPYPKGKPDIAASCKMMEVDGKKKGQKMPTPCIRSQR